MSKLRIQGWDLSLNHAAFVELDEEGSITWFKYVTGTKAAAEKSKEHGVHLHLVQDKNLERDKAQRSAMRLLWWERFLDKSILLPRMPTHVAIEDYAMRSESNSVYQIGEQGGIARILCLFRKIPLRAHDPLSVKMFGALSGNATPPQLADAIKERVAESGIDFGAYNNKVRDDNTKSPDLPEYDLSSAYVLAWLALTEVKLRSGELPLSNLPPKQVQVFQRVTKTYPVSILGREWLMDSDAAEKVGEHEHIAQLKKLLKHHQLEHLFPATSKNWPKHYEDCSMCLALSWAVS